MLLRNNVGVHPRTVSKCTAFLHLGVIAQGEIARFSNSPHDSQGQDCGHEGCLTYSSSVFARNDETARLRATIISACSPESIWHFVRPIGGRNKELVSLLGEQNLTYRTVRLSGQTSRSGELFIISTSSIEQHALVEQVASFVAPEEKYLIV